MDVRRAAKLLAVALGTYALAAAAHAACEFPYYPEYADVFGRYEEVTPLLAKKFAIENSCPNAKPGALICEPLLRRDVAGMPGSYELSFYNGDDPDIARRWNEIIKTINVSGKVSASELGEKLNFFEDDEVHWQFKSSVISAYTFGCGMVGGGGPPGSLYGYNAAFEKAAEVLKSRDLLFTRMMTGDVIYGLVFEFESRSGETAAIAIVSCRPYDSPPEVADLALLASLAEITARSLRRGVSGDIARSERYREMWKNIDESIPDDVAGQELPRVPEKNLGQTERAEP
jgi:hypothetical protein